MAEIKNEAQFEKELIEYLTTGSVGMRNGFYRSKIWEYEPSIKTTEDLWANFKKILEQHNQDVLEKPLSETEFSQIKKEISSLTSPYKAGQFLYGTNGVSELEVDLDDGRHVFLKVFDQKEIGAGNTIYQVVSQIERPEKIIGKGNARFDVTLLINGLPIIQIEEKAAGHDVHEALNQMERYINEAQYGDIFSTLQILVALTPYEARYMANTPKGRFNKDFAFSWLDQKNNPIYNWKTFADAFLSIPMAHQMSTNYMILDGTPNKESIKVMRPYQVYATQKVIEGIKNNDFSFGDNKIGYIWHTTGSGKTITSFKTAWLASRMPGVDKVVFVVDRLALTRQTAENYRAYDPDATAESLGIVQDVENTRDLKRKLQSADNNIVVTSFQKLLRLTDSKNFNPPEKNIVFIVDEAHRSVNGEAFQRIQKKFKRGAWVGYTGTPVFNSQEDSTESRFGKILHAYTIRSAIADHNVLGFKVDFETTVDPGKADEESIYQYYEKKYPNWGRNQILAKVKEFSNEEIEEEFGQAFYDDRTDHIELVVKDIYKNWRNRSNDGKYNAILTTHSSGLKPSIPRAVQFLEEFKLVNETLPADKRLKVAASFSKNDSNNNSMNEERKGLEKAMKYYNEQFGTSFTEDNEPGYTADLSSRLNKTHPDGNYLDLCIVVDRLLTGFDAPELNTLYVDRLLKGADLVQAYSRTNRIHDIKEKPWGNIVNYRSPKTAEKLMNDALAVYSNEDSAYGLSSDDKPLPPISVQPPFIEQVKAVTETLSKIKALTEDLAHVARSEHEQDESLSLFRSYFIGLSKLKQYTEYDYDHPETLIAQLGLKEDEDKTVEALARETRRIVALRKNVPPLEIDLEMTHIKDVKVNYDYLTKLIQNLLNQVHDKNQAEAEETRRKIMQFADTLDNPEYAKLVRKAADAIYTGIYPPAGSNFKYPVKLNDCDRILEEAYESGIDRRLVEFRKRWGITEIVSNREMKVVLNNHQYKSKDLDDNNWLKDIIKQGQTVYNQLADLDVAQLSKLKYRNELRKAMNELADSLTVEE